MLDHESWITLLAMIITAAPALLVVILGFCSLIDRPLKEQTTSWFVGAAIFTGLAATTCMLLTMFLNGMPRVTVELGNWVEVSHFHFSVKLLFDWLSLSFVMLSLVLCGTIGAFATKYLHREHGYNRFFMLYSVFVLGMVVAGLAGTIETLFVGWELVGLSSALLVAYFHERPAPVRNGLRVWIVYRISDAALLSAAIALHHLGGEGDFSRWLGSNAWPNGQAPLTPHDASVVGLLLLVAAAGKSALVPFSGWLPRAMEGPTPSSAVFYGSLSVHLGAYLLLRMSPILNRSEWLCAAVVVIGLTTAIFAAIACRVQNDIKAALSFASLTQVGLIVTEIGLGFYWIALAHMLSHACVRTLQFLRAPSLLYDYRLLENAIGEHLPHGSNFWEQRIPDFGRTLLYRLAIERGYLDALLTDYIAGPFCAVFRWCDSMEHRWTDMLSQTKSPNPGQVIPAPELVEELS